MEPEPVPLPLVDLSINSAGDRISATWEAAPGTRCAIEISEDMKRWRKATLLVAEDGSIVWTTPLARDGTRPRRQFYRGWR